jgi:putative transcriptional regulator
MKEKRTYKIENLPSDPTDWEALASLSEAKIQRAALSDPDAQPAKKGKLAKFKRAHPIDEIDARRIRLKLRMSQAVFAAYFGISKRTLQDWEQHRRVPEGAARTLLAVINYNPAAVINALTHRHL